MRARRLVLLLIIYVVADFSSPLPGAFAFDPDDSVEATSPRSERAGRPALVATIFKPYLRQLWRSPRPLPATPPAALESAVGTWLDFPRAQTQLDDPLSPTDDH